MPGTMNVLPLRLLPGEDLRLALVPRLPADAPPAAFVLAGIGSLSALRLRLAGADTAIEYDGDFELLSLSGSVSADGAHLHASVADAQGRVLGGHVLAGCTVRTTAEVLLATLPGWRFSRAIDPATGHAELHIEREPGPGR